MPLRLGVNIDHVATLRNARGGSHPCPIRAAAAAARAGASGITAHLREDRRHIRDRDIERLRAEISLPLNLEMAATEEMLGIALRVRPQAVCLVPERREELTTEGGLNLLAAKKALTPYVGKLTDAGIRVSLFIDAHQAQIEAASRLGAACVELHTGAYAEAWPQADAHLTALRRGATQAAAAGLEVHAGHGLTFDNVGPVAAIPQVKELNIGHFLIGEAVFIGLEAAVKQMLQRMKEARA
ncbi:MAG: pyridoxine 5'-phosphate synthase [Alphaproteobacteria bacterium]|nr:pyridoxine 5'-phosphate synthase [Alphaproteobacteria bacterium]